MNWNPSEHVKKLEAEISAKEAEISAKGWAVNKWTGGGVWTAEKEIGDGVKLVADEDGWSLCDADGYPLGNVEAYTFDRQQAAAVVELMIDIFRLRRAIASISAQ